MQCVNLWPIKKKIILIMCACVGVYASTHVHDIINGIELPTYSGRRLFLRAKLVQHVVNLEFVEMYELLPKSWLGAEGSDIEGGGQESFWLYFPRDAGLQ